MNRNFLQGVRAAQGLSNTTNRFTPARRALLFTGQLLGQHIEAPFADEGHVAADLDGADVGACAMRS